MKEPHIPDDYLMKAQSTSSNQDHAHENAEADQEPDSFEAKKQWRKKAKKQKTVKSDVGQSHQKSNKRGKKNKKRFRMNWFQRLFWFCFKLGVIALIAIALLGFWYIKQQEPIVVERFEGKKWQLPARIYARPMTLFEGAPITAEAFEYELSLLPYSSDPNISRPGTYFQDENNPERFAIYVRQFSFWDGREPAQKLELVFDGDELKTINPLGDQADPTIVRIQPLEVAGIVSEQGEDRILVRLDEVPELLIDTLLAVEDRSFYSHLGVDPKGVVRAMIANIRAGRTVQGASTLTQQLIKNYFLYSAQTYERKIKEMAMAVAMELNFSKDEILQAYLNEVWIGQDGDRAIHGFGLGANFYFGRTLKELDTQQIAMLVGMLKTPTAFNPRRNPERATQRRNQVLDIMVDQDLIAPEVADQAKRQSLGVVAKERVERKTQYPAFLDVVQNRLQETYRLEDLESEGLRIYTTLDPIWQKKAEDAVDAMIGDLEDNGELNAGELELASVMVDPQLSEVKAIIGGRDHNIAGFNRAYSAERPMGSLVKPFVYLTSLIEPTSYHLGTLLIDEEFEIDLEGSTWSPGNYDQREHGEVPMVTALAKSYNLATARLGLNVGVERILDVMQKMGMKQSVPAYPSVLLGSVNTNAYTVAQLYSTIASGGFYSPMRVITEVTGANGEPLPRKFDISVDQAIPTDVAYMINTALVEVTRSGTAARLQDSFPDTVLAGKTGTTDDYRDSWFAGYGGDYLNVVWLGKDDNKPTGLSGSSGALRVWEAITKAISPTSLTMNKPDNVHYYKIDTITGKLVNEQCQNSSIVAAIRISDAPKEQTSCGGIGLDRNFDMGRALEEYDRSQSQQQEAIDGAFGRAFDPSGNQETIDRLRERQSRNRFGDPLQ